MEFVRGQAIVGFPFGLVHKNTGAGITSGTVNVYITIDGGTQFTAGATPVHEGNGQWTMDLVGSETDGDLIGIAITHIDAIVQHFTIKTTPVATTTPVIAVTISAAGTSLVDNFEYYGTLNSADLYFDNRLDSSCWENATVKDRQTSLIQATRAIERLNFEGFKNNSLQTLQFPRNDDTDIPVEIEYATYEIAIKLLEGVDTDIETRTFGVLKEAYSGVSTTYDSDYVNIHIRAGIPSIIAWEYLLPFLRDPTRILLSRVS